MAAVLALLLSLSVLSCTPEPLPNPVEAAGDASDNSSNGESDGGNNGQTSEAMTITITVGDKAFRADIETNETGRAFMSKLPLTLEMSELNGNEKYCYGVSLPRADKYFDTLAAGDLMLYAGNCIVLFYGPAGGYSYTRIGRLRDTDGLADALGRNTASVTFEKE